MCRRSIERVWETNSFRIEFEDIDGYGFAHCEMFDERLSTFKQVRKTFKEVVAWACEEGYDGVHAYTPNGKFAEMMPGSQHIATVDNGLEVYKWQQDTLSSPR